MRERSVKSYFAVHEVVALTGFTKHMLDYLAREDIFAPSGGVQSRRGLRRRYTYADVVLLRALHAICAGKGKIRHLKAGLLKFREEQGRIEPGQRLDKQIFMQGDELCTFTKSEGIRQLRDGQLAFSFFVDLSVVSKEVADCIVVEPGSGSFTLTREAARRAEKERQRIWAPIKARRASG